MSLIIIQEFLTQSWRPTMLGSHKVGKKEAPSLSGRLTSKDVPPHWRALLHPPTLTSTHKKINIM